MINTRLCLGRKHSSEIFNDLLQAVQAILAPKSYHNIVEYCDDFLCIDDTFQQFQRTMSTLSVILQELRFHIYHNKFAGLCRKLTILGI